MEKNDKHLKNLIIKSRIQDYEVSFEKNNSFLNQFKDRKNVVFAIDENVYNLYKNEFSDISLERIHLIKAIEENKSLEGCESLYLFLTSLQTKKNTTLVAIGGGIVQDIAGFVASTIYRGITWFFVPTTLLAQTDSCIGGKTSLNFKNFKNLLGTFYPPQKIFIQTSFLKTLTQKDFYSGLGEVIKLQLTKPSTSFALKEIGTNNKFDPTEISVNIRKSLDDFDFLLKLIYENLTIKNEIIQEDEFDLGKRNILNYGHCFGHALESTSNYFVPHGIAVNVGMIYANILAQKRNLLASDIVNCLNKEVHLMNLGLELKREHFDSQKLLDCMKNDKKRTGNHLTVIVPTHSFELIKLNDVSDLEFYQALEDFKVGFLK